MLLFGQSITNNNVSGQLMSIMIGWTYPIENEPTFESEEQPLTPPVELSSVEIRLTDNDLCLINPDNIDIFWEHRFHGTGNEPTADFINDEWVGMDDYTVFNNIPVRSIWYYQARCWSRSGIPSDWSEICQIVDAPPVLPVPEITDIKTNEKDQVRLIWTDIANQISNFSHYELVKEELDVSRRLETNAVIVGES